MTLKFIQIEAVLDNTLPASAFNQEKRVANKRVVQAIAKTLKIDPFDVLAQTENASPKLSRNVCIYITQILHQYI